MELSTANGSAENAVGTDGRHGPTPKPRYCVLDLDDGEVRYAGRHLCRATRATVPGTICCAGTTQLAARRAAGVCRRRMRQEREKAKG